MSRTPVPASGRMLKLREMSAPVMAPVFSRDDLGRGASLEGPCLVEQLDATTVILSGQAARVDGQGNLWIREMHGG